MSYCVNCGVELESHLVRCPLCNTPVLNPNSPDFTKSTTPYPYAQKKGQVDTVKRTDLAVLISVILVGTAFACGMLNLLVYQQNHWSFYIIGACILLWIVCTPMLIYRRMSPYLSILLDAVAVTLYIGIVAYEFPNAIWYFELAIPIVAILTVMIEIFTFILNISRSIMVRATVIFAEIAVFFVALELLIRNFQERKLYITWSSIILTCCAVIISALLTIVARSRLREELRRRMHL